MLLSQAELALRASCFVADTTYKTIAGFMKLYRIVAIDPQIHARKAFSCFSVTSFSIRFSGRDVCLFLCNFEIEEAFELMFKAFHETVEALTGFRIQYKACDPYAPLSGWTVDMDIAQFQGLSKVMQEQVAAYLKATTTRGPDGILRPLEEDPMEEQLRLYPLDKLSDMLGLSSTDAALYFAWFCLTHDDRYISDFIYLISILNLLQAH
jgi:hypothetical protein